MKTDTSIDHFEKMTDFLSREAKSHVLDSLACVFHNEGYSLEGNTEENDRLWMANQISLILDDKTFEQCTTKRQEELELIAKAVIEALPSLADRIASRYIRISKAIRTMEKIANRQGKKPWDSAAKET